MSTGKPYHTAKELAEFRRCLGVATDDPLQPQKDQIEAAMADVPVVLKGLEKSGWERDVYLPVGNPDPGALIIATNQLASHLGQRGHDLRVSSWGIYRLIMNGLLGAEIAIIFEFRGAETRGKTAPRKSGRRKTDKVAGQVDVAKPNREGMLLSESGRLMQIPISVTPGPIYVPARYADRRDVPDDWTTWPTYCVVWPTVDLWDWWKSGTELDELLCDGPHPPDVFVFGGFKHRGLEGKQFKLIVALWKARKRSADLEDLASPVWQEQRNVEISRGQIGSVRTRCNDFFENKSLPYRVEVNGTTVSLVDHRISS